VVIYSRFFSFLDDKEVDSEEARSRTATLECHAYGVL
jgi:hypothetical protein